MENKSFPCPSGAKGGKSMDTSSGGVIPTGVASLNERQFRGNMPF